MNHTVIGVHQLHQLHDVLKDFGLECNVEQLGVEGNSKFSKRIKVTGFFLVPTEIEAKMSEAIGVKFTKPVVFQGEFIFEKEAQSLESQDVFDN